MVWNSVLYKLLNAHAFWANRLIPDRIICETSEIRKLKASKKARYEQETANLTCHA